MISISGAKVVHLNSTDTKVVFEKKNWWLNTKNQNIADPGIFNCYMLVLISINMLL